MKYQPPRTLLRIPHALAALSLLAGVCLPPAACARIPILSGSGSAKILQPEDFVPDVPVEQSPPVKWTEPGPALATDAPPGRAVFSVLPGPPAIDSGDAAPVESPVLVDSKIGDVNGRPIFASDFLTPLAARLRTEAGQMPTSRWEPWAKEQIERRLRDMITDELLRAEALSRLTPEQKQGFRAFLESMRGDLASEASGSRSLANRRLAQKEGISENEFIRRREQEALIRNTLIREINSRVNISWRDIRQRYQRDWNLFNPPPTATLRLIRIPSEETDSVQAVNDALASGTPFDEVAATSGTNYKPDEGGLDEFAFEGPYDQAEFYGSAVLNEKARSLSPGDWTGPFELGTQTAWLRLEGITTETISIYDAQLAIQDQLLSERRTEELNRYLGRLEKRASFTSLQEMRDRLFEIARARYGRRAASSTPISPAP